MIDKEKIKGLNSLRFFAFLSIFLFHSFKHFTLGYLGVDFFFVLSSFLLSFLALKELEISNTFSKKNFFIRRALRIFPLYFLVVIGLIIILPGLAKLMNWDIQLPQKPYLYFVFLSNLDKSDHLFALKFLWSIAVEEQFYILFLCFSIFFRKHFWLPISVLFITYLIYMIASNSIELDTYSNLFPHLINFAVGMLFGYLFFQQKTNIIIAIFISISSALFVFLFKESILFFPFYLSMFFAGIILLMIYVFEEKDRIMSQLFYLPEKLGVYTYGLYVYSGIMISFSNTILSIENTMIQFIINSCILIPIVIISYHFYEKRFIDLKKKYYEKLS